MQWSDEGIILATRRHGETSLIIELMTRGHGRHLGLVHGGRSRKQQPFLQAGNTVSVVWRARLDEHLGTYVTEPVTERASALMAGSTGIYGIQMLGTLLRLLPERDPHPALYETLGAILDALDTPISAGELLVRYELAVLNELGFGLDLGACAATGTNDDLAYVSPKTGRAVSRSAGAPYHGRLLALPAFLTRRSVTPNAEELREAFALTGYFLARHVHEPRGIEPSPARERLLAIIGALG